MITTLLFAVIGLILGIIAGIAPGIHPNLLSTMVVVLYEKFQPSIVSPFDMCVAILVMTISNVIIAFIPSTFLGVPESESVLSLLPSHQYLKEGRGHEAVLLSTIGALAAMVISILTWPLGSVIIKEIYKSIQPLTPWIIIVIAMILIGKEKKKMLAGTIFLVSGILGIWTLNRGNIQNPLTPLLAGLFGLPSLIMSIKEENNIPQQQLSFPHIEKKSFTKTVLNSVMVGSFCSFLPSISPSQAAVFTTIFTKESSREAYLIMVGALNTISATIGIITWYAIDKARNGTVVAMAEMLRVVDARTIMMFLAIALAICFPLIWITIKLSEGCSKWITKINYKLTSKIIIVSLILITLLLSGWKGVIVLITATAIGFIPVITQTSRNHMMGCLMIPTVLWYLA